MIDSILRSGRRLASSLLFQNTAALYAVYVSGLLLPLITFPFLARVLRPEGWGLVLFCQSLAMWLALILDYGFTFSGTRAVAALRNDRKARARVVAGIHGAKAVLLVVTLACGLLAFVSVDYFRSQPKYLVAACLYAVAQGLNPIWYFQGMERVRPAAAMDVALKALATLAILLFIREPGDGWLVLAFYAAGGLSWVTIGTVWIYRENLFFLPRRREVWATLRQSAPLFAFRGISGVYTQAAPLLLGLMTSAPVVAYFAGAERLIRAATGLIQPVSQALFPRLSYLATRDRDASDRLLRASLVILVGFGALVGGVTYLVAPLFVPILLGPGYEAAVPVLRVLALVPPIVAFGTVLGIQWALPAGHDRHMLAFVTAACGVGALSVPILVPALGATGMAIAVIFAELTVVLSLIWLASRKGVRWWPTRDPGSWMPRGVRVPHGSPAEVHPPVS